MSEALSVKNLHAYYGKSHVVQGVDIAVPENSVVGLVGRSGAGKTTLLKALMGLVPRTDGDVALFGEPLGHMKTDARARAGMGYVSQDWRVFPGLSVEENCRVVANAVSSPRPFADVIRVIPELDELRSRPAGRLSGGQQQLVALARSLTMNCRMVLMDEPTEGLMPSLVKRIGEIIRTLVEQSVAVLLVEQNVGLWLSICAQLYVLEKGRIAALGTPEELGQKGALERYLGVDV